MATLAVLRQVIGDRLGLRVPPSFGGVSSVGTKGLVSFVDTGITESDDSLRGSWVLFTSGNLVGKSYPVAGNRAGEILLRLPMAQAPAQNDAYDIYRRFSPLQIRTAINYALSQSFPLLYSKVEQEVAEDATTLEYSYPAGVQSLRQLRRRSNPTATPPTYVELPGGLWEDLGSAIRIRYRPTTGQFLQFVGLAQPTPLVAETDNTPIDNEIVVCGAAASLYSMILEGEGLSNNDYDRQQAADWGKKFEAAKRNLAMPSIPYEIHPPYARVVTAPQTLVGPINP
jgi:hypothetical protein